VRLLFFFKVCCVWVRDPLQADTAYKFTALLIRLVIIFPAPLLAWFPLRQRRRATAAKAYVITIDVPEMDQQSTKDTTVAGVMLHQVERAQVSSISPAAQLPEARHGAEA